MTTDESGSDLDLALRLADAADEISLARFGAADLQVRAKPDLTPVSDADTAVETIIRDLIAGERPGDRVMGEEFGGGAGAPSGELTGVGRTWVIDPIDGTKNFVRGVPIWATLIALFEGSRVVTGVVSAPALARRWWAHQGGGAFSQFAAGPVRRLRVSAVSELADASVTYSDLAEWVEAGRGEQFGALLAGAWRTRGYGDFLPYMLVAEGAAEVAAEPELSLWDLAALVPIVQEAGGRFSDVDGRLVGPWTTSALATNGLLHEWVVGALDPDRSSGPPAS